MDAKNTNRGPAPMFKGWDWTELLTVFNIEHNDKLEESFLAHLLKLRIQDACGVALGICGGDKVEAQAKLDKVRKYLWTMAEHDFSTDAAVWRAIAGLECNWAFTCWVTAHIEGAWS